MPYDVGLAAVERIRPLVGGDATMAQFALRWILMFDAVTVVIPGAKNAAQAQRQCARRQPAVAVAGSDGGAQGDIRRGHPSARPSKVVR